MRTLVNTYLGLAGALLLVAAGLKLFGLLYMPEASDARDLVFPMVRSSLVMMCALVLEVAATLVIAFTNDSLLKGIVLAWLSTLLLIYRLSLLAIDPDVPCQCFGSGLTWQKEHVDALQAFSKWLMGFLLVGSYSLLTYHCSGRTGDSRRLYPGNRASCFTLILAIASLGSNSATAQSHALTFAPPALDLGDVWTHKTLSRDVTLHNNSDRRITITAVNKHCSCLAAVISIPTIPPGAAATMTLRFDPTLWEGRQNRRVHLETDSGVFQLAIVGMARKTIVTSPPSANFGQLRQLDSSVTNIVLVNHSVDPWNPVITRAPRGVEYAVRRIMSNTVALELKVTPEAFSSGTMETNAVTVATGLNSSNVVTLQIVGQRQRDLLCVPDRVNFGFVRNGKKHVRQVVVTHRTLGKGFKILSASGEDSSVTAALRELSPGKYEIAVCLTPDAQSHLRLLNKSIELTTNDPRVSRQSINLIGSVVDPATAANCCGNQETKRTTK